MSNRVVWVDIAKGLGIVLVIAGHLFRSDSYASVLIFSFHMPLFFFLAGVVEHDCNLKFSEYFKKGLKGLILPWCIFYMIGLAVTLCIPAWFADFDISLTPMAIYTMSAENVHVGQIWFLACLFNVKILFYLFHKFIIKNRNMPFIVFSLAVITIVQKLLEEFAFVHFPYQLLPFQFGEALIGLLFYIMGYFYKSYKDEPSKAVSFFTFVICFVLILASPYNGHVNIESMYLAQDYFFYIFAFAGIYLTVLIAKYIEKCSWGYQNKRLLQYMGRNSLYMFALHSFGLYLWGYLVSIYRNETILPMHNMRYRDCLAGIFFVLAFTLLVTFLYKKVVRMKEKWLPKIAYLILDKESGEWTEIE